MAKKTKSKKAAKAKPATKKKAPLRKKTASIAKRAAPKKKAAPKKRAAPKQIAAPKKRSATKPAAKKKVTPKPAPMRRRDAGGHLDAKYAATLRAKSEEGRTRDDNSAFLRGKSRSSDALAEELGEQWVATATSGEDQGETAFNEEVPEERGGPFVVTTGGEEFADGADGSNPKSATREPFPTT